MRTALVIGLGFGQEYKGWLEELGYAVTTVDPGKPSDFDFADEAVKGRHFDLIYIGTPNWTHSFIARQVIGHGDIILIEKPGLATSEDWKQLVEDAWGSSRIMMVKNNQYRPEIEDYRDWASMSEVISIVWENKHRIPSPGSWFTNKSKAFGGVSRDLMPHMLSYYTELANYEQGVKLYSYAERRFDLEDIKVTDYGTIDYNGIYDVDDFCEFEFKIGKQRWIFRADWATGTQDDIYINFGGPGMGIKKSLGLCPAEAYKRMILEAQRNIGDDRFWKSHLDQDLWLHKQLEHL